MSLLIKFHGHIVVRNIPFPVLAKGFTEFWGMDRICLVPRADGQPSLDGQHLRTPLRALKCRSLCELLQVNIVNRVCVLLGKHLLYGRVSGKVPFSIS